MQKIIQNKDVYYMNTNLRVLSQATREVPLHEIGTNFLGFAVAMIEHGLLDSDKKPVDDPIEVFEGFNDSNKTTIMNFVRKSITDLGKLMGVATPQETNSPKKKEEAQTTKNKPKK